MRQPTRLQQLGLVALAAVLGLATAEGVARYRSGGAFPHANFYVPDAELGVRLEPGATMRFQLGSNPPSDIRVNAQGYRGSDWPAPQDGEILVVGDSQVFGLGVEGDETFGARLAEATGRTVLNGGVPTYGPEEYAAVAVEVARARPVSQVVLTLNMSNDLFELERPNRDRHAVWDGWAVRVETAPGDVFDFPGRTWLFRHSHLVYAARRLMAAQGPQLDPGGAPSEGVWEDLVHTADSAAQAEAEAEKAVAARQEEQEKLRARARATARDVDRVLVEAAAEAGEPRAWQRAIAWRAARGHPGDIVGDDFAESARSISLTANLIRKAGEHRQQVIDKLRDKGDVKAVLEAEAEARAALDAAERAVPVPTEIPSVMAPFLARLRADLAAEGAELVVLVLPLDLQVDPAEFAKYGAEPVDMRATLGINADIVRDADNLGLRALDVTDALRSAEPGAFLYGDLHMTPKGHAAVATALAAALEGPRPLARPAPGLPDDRTVVPPEDAWAQTPESLVRGSSKAHCETVVIDEWLRITCKREAGLVPSGVEALAGALPDTFSLALRDATTFVTPLVPGRDVRARFYWTGHHQDLEVTWDGDTPSMRLTDRASPGRPAVLGPVADHLCRCQGEARREKSCDTRIEGAVADDRAIIQTFMAEALGYQQAWVDYSSCEDTCRYVLGEATAACEARYADDCAGLLRCVRGDPGFAVDCPVGEARLAGSRQCRPLCDDAHPCAAGSCLPYRGAGVCVVGG